MNKSESKYFNTARIMDEALIALLVKKDFEYITVKEICEKAGVNRSTFYLHYESVADLLNETVEYINAQFISYFPFDTKQFEKDISLSDPEGLNLITPRFLGPYLSFIKEHRQIFKAFFKNPNAVQADTGFGYLKKNVLEPILKRFGIPADEHRYWIDFFVHGTIAIIKEWVFDNCIYPQEKIEAVIIHCVRPNCKHFRPLPEAKQ